MAKQTVLEMTQDILSALSSDAVNSISDTDESMQVATILKTSWNNIIARGNLPEHWELIQLDPSNDVTAPVLMYIPANIGKIDWIKYFDNHSEDDQSPPGYQYVTVLPVKQFIDYVAGYNPDEDDVNTFTFTDPYNGLNKTYTFNYKTEQQPLYCTIISDKYVIFDAYDNTVDSFLQASKTMCHGRVVSQFLLQDDFIPDLEDNQFPLLLNEAKALAFYELKQQVHVKAEQEVKRQWSSTQKNKQVSSRPTDFEKLPNFGRRSTWR